jgi:hypothetical protein
MVKTCYIIIVTELFIIMNLGTFQKTFYEDGIHRRGKRECKDLQELVENGLALKPKVVITTSFRRPIEVDKMHEHSERLLRGLTRRLHSHVLPLFCYNCQSEWGFRNNYGRVLNDMHYSLLLEPSIDSELATKTVQDYFSHWQRIRARETQKLSAKRFKNRRAGLPPKDIDHSDIHYWDRDCLEHFPYGDSKVEPYRMGGFWNHYLTMNHRQAFHTTFCHNRSGCKGKDRCIYKRRPELMIIGGTNSVPNDK